MTSAENWIDLRNSGFRIAFVGVFSLILAFIIYAKLTTPSAEQPVTVNTELKGLANIIFVITFASVVSVGYGVYRIFEAEQHIANTNNLLSHITKIISDKMYWKIMVISTVGYGIFFGFLSQIFIYRGDISFTEQGITIPSVNIIPCCNIPGYVPIFSAYLTDHFLIMIIPLNAILAIIVSVLVGFNISLNLYALKLTKKIQSAKRVSFIGGIGATSGLFVGCPTCAGSLFSTLLGFGAGTTISALAPFQTLFIVVSIPALIISPFFIIRGIRTSFTCKLP